MFIFFSCFQEIHDFSIHKPTLLTYIGYSIANQCVYFDDIFLDFYTKVHEQPAGMFWYLELLFKIFLAFA